jgi:hypothetical protein
MKETSYSVFMYVTDIMLVDIVNTNLREIHLISPTANIGMECIENPQSSWTVTFFLADYIRNFFARCGPTGWLHQGLAWQMWTNWLVTSRMVLADVDHSAGYIREGPDRCGSLSWLHQGWGDLSVVDHLAGYIRDGSTNCGPPG